MGLKRRNPSRTRLFTAPEVLASLALASAPAANAAASVAAAGAAGAEAVKVAAPRPVIGGDERHQMIARAAYRRAERVGFAIDPLQSWLAAEREIDAELARLAS